MSWKTKLDEALTAWHENQDPIRFFALWDRVLECAKRAKIEANAR